MANLFGIDCPRKKLLAKVGDISQVAGAQLVSAEEGRARGARIVRVRTGSGLAFDVAVDRGMDLIGAEFRGAPIGWRSPAGEAAPAFHEPGGFGFLRTFPGGWLVTCGLDTYGAPNEDAGESFGLHGRVSHTPATNLAIRQEWVRDDFVIVVSGLITQWRLFGEHLRMRRTITTTLGATSVLVEDEIENAAYRPQPHMILYHCNFGWPLVDDDSEILLSERSSRPHDENAAKGYKVRRKIGPPQNPYPEQCFFYELGADARGNTAVAMVNPSFEGEGIAAYLSYNRRQLPYLMEWKNVAAGNYVVALEPCTSPFKPRSELRKLKKVRILRPGEIVKYSLELGVTAGRQGIAQLARHIRKLK